MSIHASAIIDSKAKIGKDVSIGAFAVIGPDVEIGDGCRIWSHTTLEHVTLGQKCEVYPQVSLGLAPQHLKYAGEPTRLVVGDRTVFREGVTAHRGTALDKSLTKIGSDCYFMALSHIAHDCVIGNNVIMANAAQLAGHVTVGDNVFISTMVGVHQFVRIGRGAMISGGAMVPMDVAPHCVAQGDRATVKGLNIVGMRRMKMSRDDIRQVKNAYRAMFFDNLLLDEAVRTPELNVPNAHVKAFREFFMEPKRGFLRPAKSGSESESETEEALS